VALQLLDWTGMATDFERMLRDIFGDQINRFSNFQAEQLNKVVTKLQEIAREAVKDELVKMQSEIADLRARLAALETERARVASDSLEASF
jgi:predicted nuclease with TOPRIM domain